MVWIYYITKRIKNTILCVFLKHSKCDAVYYIYELELPLTPFLPFISSLEIFPVYEIKTATLDFIP